MNDSDFKLLPDDPKLTAYALGELEGDERAAVAAALRDHPALGAVVDEIRAMAAQLETALAEEPAAKSEPVSPVAPPAADRYPKKRGARLLRFPQIYYVVGGLAAACFAVMFALRSPEPAPKGEAKHYVELPLTGPAKTAEESASQPEVAAVALPKSEDEKPKTEESKTWAGVYGYDDNGRFGVRTSGLIAQSKQIARMNPGPAPLPVFNSETRAASSVPIENRALQRQAAIMNTTMEAVAKTGQKTWTYPQDDQFVLKAQPQREARLAESAPTATFAARMPTVPLAGAGTQAPVALSPLVPQTGLALGYVAGSTLAGTRIRADLSDAASAIHVVTPQFLSDTGGGVRSGVGVGYFGPSASNTETYAYRSDNDFVPAAQNPLSTFSADVDTASYANVRRMLLAGERPPPDAVRIEEMLNYFPFHYAGPAEGRGGRGAASQKDALPFAATMEIAEAPWAPTHRLVRIGLKGREVSTAQRGAANLVFLLDVSGSMAEPNKLPLVKESMRLLLGRLRPSDRVAIVTYAGTTGLALPSTPAARAGDIIAAIAALRADGSTDGGMGIQLAYDIAKAHFVADGINRVVLCTDGDFNVGVTSEGGLVRLIQEKAKSKVFLTVLGFGMGNLKDATLQQLADAGNGNYGYIDSRREAEKLLVEQVNGMLVPIAKDVKLQVEFNPAKVASYRLIGYEKRMLKTEDFNNDQVDAGEIGAGHAVTALYEVVPVGAENGGAKTDDGAPADELRYVGFGSAPMTMRAPRPEVAAEMLTLKVRYKDPAGDASRRLEFPMVDRGATFAEASADFKFAAAVAGFGMILRDSPHKGSATLSSVAGWAEAGASPDPGGYRAEFIGLVKRAQGLP